MTDLRLGIVQDYVPRYRVRFFDGLVGRLSEVGVDCVVIAGLPAGSQAVRGDASASPDWLRRADPREISVGRGGPRFVGYGTDRYWRDCDGVIMGLRGTAVDLHLEILRKRFSGRRIGVWGHLSRSVNPPNAVDLALERWQMRRTDHVFAYTKEGAEHAVAAGIRPQQVTAVMNSTDVTALIDAYEKLGPTDVRDFMDRYALTPGKTFGFVGGVDAPKRIPFLVNVLEALWEYDREVKLVLGGSGDQQALLTPAVLRGQVVPLGYAGSADKALIMRSSQALINPGRIGLVAVESLAVGIPILTTDWKFHAPEFDYLEPGQDVFVSRDDVNAFAQLVLTHSGPGRVEREHIGKKYPTVDQMIENYLVGVQAMFA